MMNHKNSISSSGDTESIDERDFIPLQKKNLDDFELIFEKHAEKIFLKMQEDANFMKDSSEADNSRSQAIKNLPQCLAVKRNVLRKLAIYLKDYDKMGKFVSKTSRRHLKSENFIKKSTRDSKFSSTISKKVEGYYGSGTWSYFRFVKLLLLMNLFITVVSFLFIVFPQLIFEDITKLIEVLSLFQFRDIFTGEGSADVFFSGYYSNKRIQFLGIRINLMSVYFYTMTLLYIFPLTILGFRVARSYKKSFIEKEKGVEDIFAHKILCGWDFSIPDKVTADLKSITIYNELEELLSEYSAEIDQRQSDVGRISNRIFTNAFIFILLVFIAKGLYFLLELHEKNEISSLFIPILCNLLNSILPVLFSLITSFENYNKLRHSFEITLLRTFVSGWVILGTLLVFWLSRAKNETCWETSLGREMYKLIIFDSILMIALFLGKVLWFTSKKTFENVPTKFDFNVVINIYNLIYTQSIFWSGFFFSPILPVVVTLKLIVTWYLKRFFLLNFCKPSTKAWRASRMQTYLLGCTFLNLLVIFGIMTYIYFEIPPSSCGPFKDIKFLYEIIFVTFNENSFVPVKYLKYLFKPAVVALFILSLCIRVYYVREKAKGRRKIIVTLKNLLAWGAEDKKFLLNSIESITGNDFRWELHQSRLEDPLLSTPI